MQQATYGKHKECFPKTPHPISSDISTGVCTEFDDTADHGPLGQGQGLVLGADEIVVRGKVGHVRNSQPVVADISRSGEKTDEGFFGDVIVVALVVMVMTLPVKLPNKVDHWSPSLTTKSPVATPSVPLY